MTKVNVIFIRRDEHETQPVVYQWTDGRKYRCSEKEWSRMEKDRVQTQEAKQP